MTQEDTVSVEIPKSLHEYMKKIVSLMESQSNRSTAEPYYFTIMSEKRVTCSEDSDKYVYQDPEDFEVEYESLEEARKEYVEAERDIECIEVWLESLTRYYYQYIEETRGFFFTEEAIDTHMKQNRHHMGRKAHSYVKHAWRDPEMEMVYDLIKRVGRSDDTRSSS